MVPTVHAPCGRVNELLHTEHLEQFVAHSQRSVVIRYRHHHYHRRDKAKGNVGGA